MRYATAIFPSQRFVPSLPKLVAACLAITASCSLHAGLHAADPFVYQQDDGPRFVVTAKGLEQVQLDGRVVARAPHGWKVNVTGDEVNRRLEVLDNRTARVIHESEPGTATFTYRFSREDVSVEVRIRNNSDRPFKLLKLQGLWFQSFNGPPRMVHYHWHEDGRKTRHMSGIMDIYRSHGPRQFFPGGDPDQILHGSAIMIGEQHGVGVTPWNIDAEGMPKTLMNMAYGDYGAGVQTTYRRLRYLVLHPIEPGESATVGLAMRFSKNTNWRHLVEPYAEYYNGKKGNGAFKRDHRRMLPHVSMLYYPGRNQIKIQGEPGRYHEQLAEPGATVDRSGLAKLLNARGEAVWRERIAVGQRAVFDVPELGVGTAKFVVSWDNLDGSFETPVPTDDFVWEGNTIGVTDVVLPPFEPIVQRGDETSLVMRKYRVGGLGLWSSVRAKGNDPGSGFKELLAGPIVLRGVEGETLEGAGRVTTTEPHATMYEGRAAASGVTVRSRVTTEYDGCARVELTFAPTEGESASLQPLTLEIPLRDGMAPLWHASDTAIRGNPAGHTPEGDGIVWTSREDYGSGRSNAPDFRGNFIPYVWFGAEERGLCWFADNDAGWVRDDESDAPALTLHRKDGVLTLRAHLVQKPVTLDKPRTIVFGLMATPAKPMPENWRNRIFRRMWAAAGEPDGYQPYRWMGAQYWGSYETFACKYPRNGDLSILDKVLEARRGGMSSRAERAAFAQQWVDRNMSEEDPKGRFDREQQKRLLEITLGRAADPDTTHFGGYWEEFLFTSYFHPESKVYEQAWTGTDRRRWGALMSTGLTDSYRDFAAYWGKQFVSRGMGLYFDNSYPARYGDPLTSTAYRLPDGRIQPTAGIWARRAYLKRMWLIHRLHEPEGAPVMMTVHMTNANIVPYLVWNDTNLDLEWGDRTRLLPRQKSFSPAFLRAESLGLKTGNIPQGLAHEFEEFSVFAAYMVHEIQTAIGHPRARKMFRDMLTFGYGREGTEVINYWDETTPIAVDDEKCKWLVMRKGDRLMVLLCTWNADASRVRLTIHEDRLAGADPRVADAESGKQLPVEGNEVTLDLPAYGARLITIEAKPGP